MRITEIIYNTYLGAGNNVNYNSLHSTGLFEDHPYMIKLTREDVLRILKEGGKNENDIIIHKFRTCDEHIQQDQEILIPQDEMQKRSVHHFDILHLSVKKVVGEAYVKTVLVDSPEDLWNKTKSAAGINKKFYDSYFIGYDTAVAFELDDVKEYDNAKELSEYDIKTAPQSFVYMNDY